MRLLSSLIDTTRSTVRRVAAVLNRVSGGQLNPSFVTLTGLLAHIPIAWLIAARHPIKAAVLLIIFGLFDVLDGELARLQQRTSSMGMLFDATSDRVKEVLLYSAAAYNIIAITGRPYLAVWAVSACGASLLVSYLNAWGEALSANNPSDAHTVNTSFRVGLAGFEVRMFIFLVGLLSGRVALAMIVITIAAVLTAIARLLHIVWSLRYVQD